MKKRFWKVEYSITIFVIFSICLMFVPTGFITTREAAYISLWNETINKMEYVFSAMNAHADADIAKGLRNAKDEKSREQIMMTLVKPYLRISESNSLKKKYTLHYLNSSVVKPEDRYYFDKLYLIRNNKIIGIKDIKDEDLYHPVFLMMFDMNGLRGPNTWGKDVFGLNIFIDGNITPIGSGWKLDDLKSDCSDSGTGVACSYYLRIGGNLNE